MLMFSRLLLQLWRGRLEEAPASIIHPIYSEREEVTIFVKKKKKDCLNNLLSASQALIT